MEKEETQLLIIPGLGGSGADHWQSFWLQKFNASERVNQENWKEPKLKDWLTNLNEAILRLDCPTILVAHSLAVSLVLHWVNTHTNPNIKGALLVAPADVDDPMHTPEIVRGFAPMPTSKLPFPSIVVASENDDFVSLERAKYFAEQWHSDFKNIGLKGHINSDSKLEFWEEGQVILEQLIKMTK